MSLQVRILLTVLALLLLPVYSVVAGAEETAIRISISPTSGPVETSIAVTGVGANPDYPVQVMLAANGETGAGAVTVVQVDPDPAHQSRRPDDRRRIGQTPRRRRRDG